MNVIWLTSNPMCPGPSKEISKLITVSISTKDELIKLLMWGDFLDIICNVFKRITGMAVLPIT